MPGENMGIVTVEKLENADKDADALEKFVEGGRTEVVKTRKNKEYPTLENAVYQIIETGGFEPFSTEVELLKSTPTLTKKAAKALDTKKVWLWDGKWNDTGPSELDLANQHTNEEINKTNQDLSKASMALQKNNAVIENVLIALTDKNLNPTWLQANAKDGGLTELATLFVRLALQQTFESDENHMFAITDKNKVFTELCLNKNGDIPDWVLERWSNRLSVSSNSIDYFQNADGDLVQFQSNARKIAGYGSSTMSRLSPFFEEILPEKIEYLSRATGGERAVHTSLKYGIEKGTFKVNGSIIPESGTVSLITDLPIYGADDPIWEVAGYINGVHGTLTSSLSNGYTFTRTESGSAVPSSDSYIFVSDWASDQFDTLIICTGKNDLRNGLDTVENVNSRIIDMFNSMQTFVKRCLILSNFVNSDAAPNSSQHSRIKASNDALKARFGNLFVDVNSYILSDQIWLDTGITPTANDLYQQSIGNKADSLSKDESHFNNAGHTAVAKFVFKHMKNLGWY